MCYWMLLIENWMKPNIFYNNYGWEEEQDPKHFIFALPLYS